MTVFENTVFADVIRLKRGHTGIGWALNPITGVIIRKPCDDTCTQTYREEGHEMTRAEIGGVQLQTKEC